MREGRPCPACGHHGEPDLDQLPALEVQCKWDLKDAYVAVLELLRDHHLAEGDVAACRAVARRILAIEPTSEETHRALMAAYARRGQHHLALRQYRDCVAVLRDVLDTRPGEATERLVARIRRREAV